MATSSAFRTTIGPLKKETARLSKQLKEMEEAVREAANLSDVGLSIPQVQKIRNLIVNISTRGGIPIQEAYNAFEKNVVDHYDNLLGLGPKIARLIKENEGIAEQKKFILEEQEEIRKAAKKEFDRIEAQYDAMKEKVEAYSELRKRGIDAEVLMRWDKIIESTNLTRDVIEAELMKQSSLEEEARGKENEIKALSDKKSKLEEVVDDLERKNFNLMQP